MILPLIFSTPFAPNFIVLTVFGGALPIILVPVIIVAVLWLINKKGWFLSGYETKWWQSAVLFVIGAIGVWGTYGLIQSFIGAIAGAA
jgi:hypothetical protein